MQLSITTQRRDQAVDLIGLVNEALAKRSWQQGCSICLCPTLPLPLAHIKYLCW